MSERKSYLEPYRRAVEERGASWDAQLWKSSGAQAARFGVLVEGVRLRGARVVDLGCGRGDLVSFAVERGERPGAYVGVDAIPEMVACARARAGERGWEWCGFEVGDFVEDAGLPERLVREQGSSVVIACGSLNTLAQGVALEVMDRWWGALAGVSGGVLAFNFLCERAAPASKGDPAVRFDQHAVLAWAFARSGRVTYRRDYLGDLDATVVMRRPG